MKWSKFKLVVEEHPWLLQLIDTNQLLVDPETSGYDEKRLGPIREFARHKLEYIAFRPFATLAQEMDIRRDCFQVTRSCAHASRCEPYLGGDKDAWYDEEWQVMTHNGAGIISGWALHDGTSLLDTIAMIEQKNAEVFMGQDDLSFDFIVKVATKGRHTEKGKVLTNMTVDVYPFPLWYQGPLAVERMAQKKRDREGIAGLRNYARHESPPPIIPGTLQFAGK